MTSRLSRFESSGFLPVATAETIVFVALVVKEESLHSRILDACRTTRSYPVIFEPMRRSMMRRVEAYAESHRHFEYTYYKCKISAATCKLNVLGHMSYEHFSCFGMWNSCPKFVCNFRFVYRLNS
jgi:hypothetical protein